MPRFFRQIAAELPHFCRFSAWGCVLVLSSIFSNTYAQNFQNIAPDEDLPTLLGISTPNFDDNTELGDPTLAPALAQLGHTHGALLEYHKLAHTGSNSEAAHALLEAAKLAISMGENQLARKSLEHFLLRFKAHENAPQAFYLLASVVENNKRLPVIRLATSLYPEDDWVFEAQYAYFWHQAYENGFFAENDVSDPRLNTLKTKLDNLNSGLYAQKYQAIFAGVPALYPLLLKEKGAAFWQVLLILLLLWNIWYHWRHLNMPFTVFLLCILGYSGVTFQKENLKNIQLYTLEMRHTAMETWVDLHPKTVN